MKLKRILKKIFYIEKPSALPMRFHAGPDDFTWEDWQEKAKKEHPIKYFFSETLPLKMRVKITMRFEDLWYWIISHTIRKYHLLSLSQPVTHTCDDYDWGWLDEDRQLLFANFNILCNYVDSRNSSEYHYHVSPEGIEALKNRDSDDGWDPSENVKALQEILDLYNYWKIIRKEESKELDKIRHDWHENAQKDRKTGGQRWNLLKQKEEEFDKHEEDMLIRLIKVRKFLWT